ncbi:hypothetical protein BV25DRAFT_1843180 [Artomyces pyxidatus]|uniref:Uncharacterized protein n=2 Tax=Artomyces pyxidatus TaxID=48021 RepID=A0ACB8SGV9_9AGAM|nr:hypothetical protein BV25DRAFT_1843177 [Artomyces pyxidatus]KAI0055121.1 hypothetical protein BV25DRAFT_1843180 [Artomyces pyxidatus]
MPARSTALGWPTLRIGSNSSPAAFGVLDAGPLHDNLDLLETDVECRGAVRLSDASDASESASPTPGLSESGWYKEEFTQEGSDEVTGGPDGRLCDAIESVLEQCLPATSSPGRLGVSLRQAVRARHQASVDVNQDPAIQALLRGRTRSGATFGLSGTPTSHPHPSPHSVIALPEPPNVVYIQEAAIPGGKRTIASDEGEDEGRLSKKLREFHPSEAEATNSMEHRNRRRRPRRRGGQDPDQVKDKACARSKRRMDQKLARKGSEKYQAQSGVSTRMLKVSSSGWMGVRTSLLTNAQMLSAWRMGDMNRLVAGFQKIPFRVPLCSQPSVEVRDEEGRMFFWRSDYSAAAMRLLQGFQEDAAKFVQACTPFPEGIIEKNSRGQHWFSICGHDRNNKTVPSLSEWHQKNAGPIEDFFRPGGWADNIRHFCLISQVLDQRLHPHRSRLGSSMVEAHFPGIAQRYRRCHQVIKDEYGIEPLFGLFYNFCLNAARPGVPRVFCQPHVDWKNIAIGVCLIFVYGENSFYHLYTTVLALKTVTGKFNHREKAWLVIWEAGIIVEVPPGIFVAYPSSLFYHFNLDPSSAIFVTTEDGLPPTLSTGTPLNGEDGRGSAVWFNQATMFQTAELGYNTVEDARSAGVDPTCNTEALISKQDCFPL